MNDSFCIFLTQELEKDFSYQTTPKQLDQNKVVVIPHSYDSEEEYFKEDVALLCGAYPVVAAALETGESCSVEVTLTEMLAIVPRKRARCDAYARLQRYLLTRGVNLVINSNKTKKK